MEKLQSLKNSLEQAQKSPLNTSKSKAMFTFTKQERFPISLLKENSTFYEKTSMLNKRAPSFGYGEKSEIALKKTAPSPDKYTLASDFQKSPKIGKTIGHGRQECKSISIFTQTKYPGPGLYNIQRDKQNIKNMTMSSKLEFPPLWVNNNAPAPGTYQISNVDSNGYCSTSKYSSKNGFKIHTKSPQKQDKMSCMLGPGAYDTVVPSIGKQPLAQNRTENSFVFGKKVRQTMKQSTISPGPGAYPHYSIFGI